MSALANSVVQQYHPDDIKGKGEPSYSIEKALKGHRHDMADGIEMSSGVNRPRSANGEVRMNEMWGDGEVPTGNVGRSNTTGRNRHSGGQGTIKRRFGSIRRSLGGKKDD